MNPLLNQTATAPTAGVGASQNLMQAIPQAMPQLKEMANQIKSLQASGGDMNSMLMNSLGQNNPLMQSLMGGGNPEQMVRAELEKQGINVNEFMQQIQTAFNS